MALAAQDQINRQPAPATLAITVAPSTAVELYWATMINVDGQFRVEHPVLQQLAAARPDLLAELRDFWGRDVGDSPEVCGTAWSFPELLVLADEAGVLAGESFTAMLSAVATQATKAAPVPRLGSESPRDRDIISDRLVTLRSDAAIRQAWLALLGAVADELDGHWSAVGRAVVQRACRARTSQLPWADDLAVIREWAQNDFGGILDRVLDQATADGQPVLVTPSYWSGKGVLFDLPNHVLMGIPAQTGARDSRSRTEPLVGGLRALADPTRLAIVDYLVDTPRTVGELAEDFRLAQPTISRHVRVLREAGLVTETRHGNAVLLGTNPHTVRALLDGIAAALVDRAA